MIHRPPSSRTHGEGPRPRSRRDLRALALKSWAVRRQRVSSSVIASVGYDPATSILEIELLDGAVYRYFAVPVRQVEELLTATSIGRFYNQVIKPRYPYERLDS